MRIFKFLAICLLLFILGSWKTIEWNSSFEDAVIKAKKENKLVLLNFSGSDWCKPCIMLKRKIFQSDEFISYANDNLVLVNADFPRLKKNALDKRSVEDNEKLAEQYNRQGEFPLTLLIDVDGKILARIDRQSDSLKDYIAKIDSSK